MPGRSVTVASGWFLIAPSLRSTVTPGKFPTCWFEPVSWLNSVVFPQFWFPARANVSGAPFSSTIPCFRCSFSYLANSPTPGWGVSFRLDPVALRGLSFLCTFFTVTLRASSSLRVSSYPRTSNCTGSPIGATFCKVISASGVSPISSRWWRKAPLPPTVSIYALSPGFNSSIVILTRPP